MGILAICEQLGLGVARPITGKPSVVKDAASRGADLIASHLSKIQKIAGTHNIAMN